MSTLAGPLLNSDSAAEYCGFRGGGQTMRDLKSKDPSLPWHKLGKLLVFYPEELDAWIKNRLDKEKPVGATTGRNKNSLEG